jgi:LysR family transcriptional regulator, nod-box dependent transcriptional activator
MHFQNLDLNLLVALDTLLEERSVSRAAERLYLTQSATSSALSRLREYFNDDLLVSVGRRMEPTALALSLAPQVRNILQQIRVTIETRPSFDPQTAQRRFRIMTSDYLVHVLLAEVVQRLAVLAPGVQVQILPSGDAAMAMFLRGEIDLMITPDRTTLAEHPQTLLFEETFSCVVWTGNPLVGSTMSPEMYFSLGHITVQFGQDQLTILERWFADQPRTASMGTRRVEVIAPSFGVVPHLVVGTNRIATMHTRHARLFERLLPLRVLPAPEGFPAMREMIQWPRHLDTDPAIRWLVDLLIASGQAIAPAA